LRIASILKKESKTMMNAPVISEDIWGDTQEEVEQAYYTVRYYNPSGFGVEREWLNVCATSEQDAKWFAQGNYRIAQGNMYRLCAFKQGKRI
jgi:hypothetical protein